MTKEISNGKSNITLNSAAKECFNVFNVSFTLNEHIDSNGNLEEGHSKCIEKEIDKRIVNNQRGIQ